MPKITIINLTEDEVTILDNEDGDYASFEPCDNPARVEEATREVTEVTCKGVRLDIVTTTNSGVVGLPQPQEGVNYIVTAEVALTARAFGRPTDDLLIPREPVFNGSREITAYLYLARLPEPPERWVAIGLRNENRDYPNSSEIGIGPTRRAAVDAIPGRWPVALGYKIS